MDALANTFTPTDEQLHILSLIENTDDNILVNALAGTGKTTTLDLVQAASPEQPVLCLAFNKRIAEEMEKRFPSTTTVRTFNGLGHRVWGKTVSKLSFDPKKMQTLLKAKLDEFKGEDRRELRDIYWDLLSAVSMAKNLGYVPEGKFPHAKRLITTEQFHATLEEEPTPLVIEIIDALLIQSVKSAYEGLIDYNDQIYMPALFGGTFPRFPHVLVDEAQDLSPTNHAMLDKLVKGRISAVGDRWQSIYGFRGAVLEGMEKLREKFSMCEAGLTRTFRCPKAIVENAHWRVPQFKWMKEGGHVEQLNSLAPADIPDGSAIICRNNAPLFRCAFDLLAARRSVQVGGSDIGPKLVGLLRKIGVGADSRDDLFVKIEGWRIEKLQSSRQAPSSINDTADCLKIFVTWGPTLDQAVAYAEWLFKQQGTLKLLTGHKAKGLEWDNVYFLDPWLIGDDEQEMNLRYVIQTRAKQALYMIDSKDIRWDTQPRV